MREKGDRVQDLVGDFRGSNRGEIYTTFSVIPWATLLTQTQLPTGEAGSLNVHFLREMIQGRHLHVK